jgi:hypothetical protein
VVGDEVAERVQPGLADGGELDAVRDGERTAGLGPGGGQEGTPEPVVLEDPVPRGAAHRADGAPVQERLCTR